MSGGYAQSPTAISPRGEMAQWIVARWTVGVVTAIYSEGGELRLQWTEWCMNDPFPSKHLVWHAYCQIGEWDAYDARTGTPIVCGNGSLWIWQEDGSLPGTWLHFRRIGNFKFHRGDRP